MRVVAIEEHFSVPALAGRISAEAKAKRGFVARSVAPGKSNPLELLPDLGRQRLDSMDAGGITMAVLSASGPGADLVDGQDGVDLARAMNDALAEACRKHPDRFAGFAHLPMRSPDAAAKELERCVKSLGFHGALINGTCEDKFLDDPRYAPLLSAAEQLDLPVYIHPHLPPPSVHQTYYANLPGSASVAIATAGWGWHSEVAIHVLRMVLAGTLDKHRKLKLIIGHMGEGLPAMLARLDDVSVPHVQHLSRPVSRTILDHVWITTSGMFTEPPLLAAMLTFGMDRIMFSVDYPYSPNERGRDFLKTLNLSPDDMTKFTHGTADKLLRLKVKSA